MRTDKNVRDFKSFFSFTVSLTRQATQFGDLTLSGGEFCGGELTVNRSARYKQNPHLRI